MLTSYRVQTPLAVPEFESLKTITKIPPWSVYLVIFIPSTTFLIAVDETYHLNVYWLLKIDNITQLEQAYRLKAILGVPTSIWVPRVFR